jgi:hypothetical protein
LTIDSRAVKLFKKLTPSQINDFLTGYGIKQRDGSYLHKTPGHEHRVFFTITSDGSLDILNVDGLSIEYLDTESKELVNSLILKMKMDLSQLLESGWK